MILSTKLTAETEKLAHPTTPDASPASTGTLTAGSITSALGALTQEPDASPSLTRSGVNRDATWPRAFMGFYSE